MVYGDRFFVRFLFEKNMAKNKTKIVFFTLPLFLAIYFVFALFEPTSVGAVSDDTSFDVGQSISAGISLSCDSTIIITPSFPSRPTGLTPVSGPAKDDFDCTVITNNSAGFSLKVKNRDWGGTNIALVHNADSNYKFTNYTSSPTFNWTDPSSGQALFAFTLGAANLSAASEDIAAIFKNDTSSCGSGSGYNDIDNMDSAKCWRGLNDTNEITVANSSDETTVSGELFRFRFQARANETPLKGGDYTTELTVTATY